MDFCSIKCGKMSTKVTNNETGQIHEENSEMHENSRS
jgi:hypothetical protein